MLRFSRERLHPDAPLFEPPVPIPIIKANPLIARAEDISAHVNGVILTTPPTVLFRDERASWIKRVFWHAVSHDAVMKRFEQRGPCLTSDFAKPVGNCRDRLASVGYDKFPRRRFDQADCLLLRFSRWLAEHYQNEGGKKAVERAHDVISQLVRSEN